MMKSGLLHEEVVQKSIQKLNEVKDYLICAATGEVDKNDPTALEHLIALVYISMDLNDLLKNLPFITVDIENLSKS